jgi:hypothetical protein
VILSSPWSNAIGSEIVSAIATSGNVAANSKVKKQRNLKLHLEMTLPAGQFIWYFKNLCRNF